MKSIKVAILITTALAATPIFAEENVDPWRSFVGVQGGFFDSSDASFGGVEGGLGYKAGPLVHYLFLGAGQVHRDDEGKSNLRGLGALRQTEPDLDEFEIGYRIAYDLNEKISVFAELGNETYSGDLTRPDALGNPTTLTFDSHHCFFGAGLRMEVWKGLNLDFSCRYLPSIDDAAFSSVESDQLGNPMQIKGDTPNFLVKLGISYGF